MKCTKKIIGKIHFVCSNGGLGKASICSLEKNLLQQIIFSVPVMLLILSYMCLIYTYYDIYILYIYIIIYILIYNIYICIIIIYVIYIL